MQYSELQVTTNFSFLRGASHPEEFIEQAAALNYRAVAITDLHSLAGVVRAHTAAKKAGVQLIIGCRIELFETIPVGKEVETEESTLPCSLLLYPTNRASYGRMSSLLTTGKLRAPKAKCFLTEADLEEYQEGLLAVANITDLRHPQLSALLLRLKQIFDKDRLSIAISSSYGSGQKKRLKSITALSRELSIPLVVTNDAYYHEAERRALQDALTCIRLGCTIQNAGFALFQNAERHLKTVQEMNRLFAAYPKALARVDQIVELASGFSLDQLKYEYPKEICPEGKTPAEYLRELVISGARERYPNGLPKSVAAQIKHELELIRELDYEKYFLTVHDIVTFARSKSILCQGRGAAANSAVCYVLGITAVDPAQINLLVERFISKERNEPPDIDIDFEHERREEVIQYIYEKYGRLRAALTAEVICYRSKSSLRDIAKVFGFSEEEVPVLSKIRRRAVDGAMLREKLVEAGFDPEKRAIELTFELAQTLRSFPRHLSQHVGGFIISDPPLSEIVPIENAAMADRTVIEWDKDDIEQLGMLKIDVLGLGMLTCIRKAMDIVNHGVSEPLHPAVLSLHTVPREDPEVYRMITRADTIGVFQIESRAQMAMLPRLRPRCFYDLVIEVAIVRPGPIQGGMVHPYLKRRSGQEKVSYPNERVRKILERTLGVPIFQEQVMELAVVTADFSPGEADGLRRAMASWRKNANALLQFEERLKSGMKKNGYSDQFAHQLFEQMKGFGEYGFPQSHAASFAHLVYVSAWLKQRYPAAFTAGLLNSLPMGFYQPAQLIQDLKNHGVEVLEVDVNDSGWDCTLEKRGSSLSLRLGTRLVKGLREEQGLKLAAAVKARGPFASILQLWRASGVRIDQLKRLANADAFRSMKLDRQQALWQLKKLRDEHLPLFESVEDEEEEQADLPALSEKLHVLRDYQTTGLSLKAHPMTFVRPYLSEHGVLSVEEYKKAPNGRRAAVAGLVLVRQQPSTANGIIFMTVEDETGMANMIIKPQIAVKFSDAVYDSIMVVISGVIQYHSEVRHLVAEELIDISSAYTGMGSASRDFH